MLLILAAVTINALSGDNGIFKRASGAKKGTNQSNVEEVTKLSIKWTYNRQIRRYKYNNTRSISR